MRAFAICCLLLSSVALTGAPAEPAVRITILSDAFGPDKSLHKDWGFSALVEYGEIRILFDTGNDAEHLAANARALEVDLSRLDFAVISHRHGDHTDGLRHLLEINPGVTIYVPDDEYFGGPTPVEFFRHVEPDLPSHMRYFDGKVPPVVPHGTPWKGATFIAVPRAFEPAPGVRLVANLSPGPAFAETPEISLALETPSGVVLVVGCSHPGIERILDSVGKPDETVRLLVGGLHQVRAPREEVARLSKALDRSVSSIAPGHCTGEHAFAELRRVFGQRYVHAGVGSVIVVGARD